jgi:hypothetical protein
VNTQQIIEAADAVAWLAEQAGAQGEDGPARIQMALALVMARSYLLEYAAHVTRGMEPYDALMAAARGELVLSQSQRDMLKALMPPPQTDAAG